jgi:preprotein translocase subunit SecG
MSILIAFLTLVLVVNCVFLILLVLIQLPKKEAGAGLAFGAGATDALFGAGSGNALTKLTKYSAVLFLALSMVVGILNTKVAHAPSSTLREKLAAQKPAAAPVVPAAAPASPFQSIPQSNVLNTTLPATAPSTNAALTKAPATTTPGTNASAPK